MNRMRNLAAETKCLLEGENSANCTAEEYTTIPTRFQHVLQFFNNSFQYRNGIKTDKSDNTTDDLNRRLPDLFINYLEKPIWHNLTMNIIIAVISLLLLLMIVIILMDRKRRKRQIEHV